MPIVPKILERLFSIDARSLAALRIGLGIIILADLIARIQNFTAFHTDYGVLPRAAGLTTFVHGYAWSLHFVSGGIGWQIILFLIAAVAGVLLVVGYKTRTMTVISWVLMVSIQYRNPMILQGGDIVLRLLAFWAIFLPLGATYSIDAALQKVKHQTKKILSWGTVAILLQIGILYWFTTALKTGYEWIPDGTAVYFALMIDQFTTPIGLWLRQFPTLLQYLTYIVFALEMCAIGLLFPPYKTQQIRLLGIVLLSLFHISLITTMAIGLFPFANILSLTIFIPGSFWDWVDKKIKPRQITKIEIKYAKESPGTKKLLLIATTFLGISQKNIVETTVQKLEQKEINKNSLWILQENNEKIYDGGTAILQLIKHSPIFFALFKIVSLSYIRRPFIFIYNKVCRQKDHILKSIDNIFQYKNISVKPSLFGSIVALILIEVVLFWNIFVLVNSHRDVPIFIKHIVYAFHLDQKWSMFAPYPLKDDGWYIIEGHTKSGKIVDPYHQTSQPPKYQKPAVVSKEYPNRYWRKYLMTMHLYGFEDRIPYFAHYLCYSWNKKVKKEKDYLTNVTIYFMDEVTKEDYKVEKSEKRMLISYPCKG